MSRPTFRLSLIEVLVLCAALAVAGGFLLRNPAQGAIAVALVAVVAISVVLRRRRRLHGVGYFASREGRDQIRYEERADGGVRALVIDGDVGNPHLVYVPSPQIWDRTMPPWARSRRDEIVGRIKEQLGEAKYEFRELKATDA